MKAHVALTTPENGVSKAMLAAAGALFRFTDNELGRTFGDDEYERKHGRRVERGLPCAFLPDIAARAHHKSKNTTTAALKALAKAGWITIEVTGRANVYRWTSKWAEVYAQQARGKLHRWHRKDGSPPSSLPRTRISESESHAAPSAASAPSSPPAMAPAGLELPAELEQLPGAIDAGEVMEIVRSEHQRAVQIKHPRRSSSLVPSSREVMQWALIVGALAVLADDTRSDAVRRGVALGMRKYVELEGHRSKTHGTLADEGHPGRWLVHHLPQLELLVREHYTPPSQSPRGRSFADTEQREHNRDAKRREAARVLAAGGAR